MVDGKTGFLVPFGDVGGFARRMLEVLENEPLRRTLSDQAIAHARRFNWDDSADAVLTIIEQVVSGR